MMLHSNYHIACNGIPPVSQNSLQWSSTLCRDTFLLFVSPHFFSSCCPTFVLDVIGCVASIVFIDDSLSFVELNVDPVSNDAIWSVSCFNRCFDSCSSSGCAKSIHLFVILLHSGSSVTLLSWWSWMCVCVFGILAFGLHSNVSISFSLHCHHCHFRCWFLAHLTCLII